MNTYFKYLIILCIGLCIASCSDENYYVSPKATFNVVDENGAIIEGDIELSAILDKITIQNSGEGNYFSVYTGDEGHVYALRDSGDTGLPMNDAMFEYTYTKVGQYQLTVLATGYNNQTGEQSTDTKSIDVTVTDARNSIEELQIASLYNIQIGAETPKTKDYMIAYPNANNDISVYMWHYSRYFALVGFSLKTYSSLADVDVMPTITTNSENTDIMVGQDTVISGETAVNHLNDDNTNFEPQKYTIVSASGLSNDYTISLMMLPDFKSFSINSEDAFGEADLLGGSPLTTAISPSQIGHYSTTITLPTGTDLSNLAATFENYQSDVIVTVDGVQQVSGITTNDFTEPVTYTLTRKMPGYETRFISESTVKVTVELE